MLVRSAILEILPYKEYMSIPISKKLEVGEMKVVLLFQFDSFSNYDSFDKIFGGFL